MGSPKPENVTGGGQPSPVAVSGNAGLIGAAVRGACPACDAPTLFAGWARFDARCRTCGQDFQRYNVGDGPAAFLTMLFSTIALVGALALDAVWGPPWWVHVLIWVPVVMIGTLFALRVSKALLLHIEHRRDAREGQVANQPSDTGAP